MNIHNNIFFSTMKENICFMMIELIFYKIKYSCLINQYFYGFFPGWLFILSGMYFVLMQCK